MDLRIGVIKSVSTECAFDRLCQRKDYMVDATRLACDQMRLNCSFFWYNGSDYGDANETTGIGTGFIGAIQRGEFDTSIPIFSPTYRRFQAISFGELFDFRETSLMTRAPTDVQEDFDWSIVSAFQWQVWTLFFLFLVLNAGLISILHKSTSGDQSSLLNIFFDLHVCLIVNEFKQAFLRHDRVRFHIGLWLFGAFVLTTAYTGTLFSSKVLTKNKLPFTNLETFVQCLETQKCRIITSSFAISYLQRIISPDYDLGTRIQASFNYNPAQLTPASDIPRAILDETNQYLVNIRSREEIIFMTDGNRDCFYYALDLNLAEMVTFPFAKNSTHAKTLNRMTLFLREFGLAQVMKRRYSTESLCDKRPSETFLSAGQTLTSIAITFCFYVLGIFVGFLGFLIEIWSAKFLHLNAAAYRQGAKSGSPQEQLPAETEESPSVQPISYLILKSRT